SEGVGRQGESEVASRIDAGAGNRSGRDGEFADLELARFVDVGSGRHAGMIIDRRERPAGLLRCGCEAAEEPGKPEAHAAFIGLCTAEQATDHRAADDCSRVSCNTMSNASSRGHGSAPEGASCANTNVFLWRATDKLLVCLFRHISTPSNPNKHLSPTPFCLGAEALLVS